VLNVNVDVPRAPTPPNEAERLRALYRHGVLDTIDNPRFDRLTRLAARSLDVPMCLISLIDRGRQVSLSQSGMLEREYPRDLTFCAHTILGHDLFEVPDATRDARFAVNPLVTGPPGLRYYAGYPLISPEGLAIGTMCVIDTVPREPLEDEPRAVLRDLAGTAMDLIEAQAWALEAESERQLALQAAVLKDDYLNAMAHELRTPVNAMTGFGELLRMTGAPNVLTDSQRGYLDSIIEAGEYMGRLINETLIAQTPASSALETDQKGAVVLLDPVLKAVGRLLLPLARKQNVALMVAEAGEIAVWGDALRIRQVLINLISNAVKYNRCGGSVTVSVAAEAGCVSLTCEDTGQGIAEADLPDMLSPFNRGGAADGAVEGTGLGLYITDRLVRAMGGRVAVDSTLGVGTTITVMLERAH